MEETSGSHEGGDTRAWELMGGRQYQSLSSERDIGPRSSWGVHEVLSDALRRVVTRAVLTACKGLTFNEHKSISRGSGMIIVLFPPERNWRTIAIPLVLAVTLTAIPAAAQETARAKAIGQKLMCVCGCNQILTACNHVGCPYSRGMIKELDQDVARNETDELTLQAFVQEYGPTVLAEPPTKGFNWAAWIVPIVVPLVALYLVWQVVCRWNQRAALAPAFGSNVSPDLLARARRESDKDAND